MESDNKTYKDEVQPSKMPITLLAGVVTGVGLYKGYEMAIKTPEAIDCQNVRVCEFLVQNQKSIKDRMTRAFDYATAARFDPYTTSKHFRIPDVVNDVSHRMDNYFDNLPGRSDDDKFDDYVMTLISTMHDPRILSNTLWFIHMFQTECLDKQKFPQNLPDRVEKNMYNQTSPFYEKFLYDSSRYLKNEAHFEDPGQNTLKATKTIYDNFKGDNLTMFGDLTSSNETRRVAETFFWNETTTDLGDDLIERLEFRLLHGKYTQIVQNINNGYLIVKNTEFIYTEIPREISEVSVLAEYSINKNIAQNLLIRVKKESFENVKVQLNTILSDLFTGENNRFEQKFITMDKYTSPSAVNFMKEAIKNFESAAHWNKNGKTDAVLVGKILTILHMMERGTSYCAAREGLSHSIKRVLELGALIINEQDWMHHSQELNRNRKTIRNAMEKKNKLKEFVYAQISSIVQREWMSANHVLNPDNAGITVENLSDHQMFLYDVLGAETTQETLNKILQWEVQVTTDESYEILVRLLTIILVFMVYSGFFSRYMIYSFSCWVINTLGLSKRMIEWGYAAKNRDSVNLRLEGVKKMTDEEKIGFMINAMDEIELLSYKTNLEWLFHAFNVAIKKFTELQPNERTDIKYWGQNPSGSKHDDDEPSAKENRVENHDSDDTDEDDVYFQNEELPRVDEQMESGIAQEGMQKLRDIHINYRTMENGLRGIIYDHGDDGTLEDMCDAIKQEAEDILVHILDDTCAMSKFKEIVNNFRNYEAICKDKFPEIKIFDFNTI